MKHFFNRKHYCMKKIKINPIQFVNRNDLMNYTLHRTKDRLLYVYCIYCTYAINEYRDTYYR